MNIQTNGKVLVLKIVSCLLLTVSISMIFLNWLTLKPENYRQQWDINEYMDEVGEELRDMEHFIRESEMDYWEYGDAKRAYKSVRGLYRIIKDVSLSPREAIPFTVDMFTLHHLLKKYDPFIGDRTEIVYKAGKWIGFAVAGVTVLAVALGLLALILHLCNKPGCGSYAMIFDVILALVFVAMVIVAHIIATPGAPAERIYPTAWPFVSVSCSIASCVCWSIAVKIKKSQISAYMDFRNYGMQPGYGMPMNAAGMGMQPGYGMPMNAAGMGMQPGYGMPMNAAGMGMQPGYGMPINAAGTGMQPGYGMPINAAGTGMQPGYGAAINTAGTENPQERSECQEKPESPETDMFPNM